MPFVIITPGRSGSTYLVKLLDQHPEIEARQELFNRSNFDEDSFNQFCQSNVLAFLFNRERISHFSWNLPLHYLMDKYLDLFDFKTFGFKVSIDQLQAYPYLIATLKRRKFKFIYLSRKDKNRLTLSMLKAKTLKDFDHYSTQKIYIDSQEFLKERNQIINNERWFYEQQVSHLKLNFEDLEQSLELLVEFLALPDFTFHWDDSGRLNPIKISDWVENWEDLKSIV